MFLFFRKNNKIKGKNLKPVENFQLEKFLGKWYELVRYDHYFEKFQINVFSNYSINKNGEIEITNYGKLNDKTISISGIAKFKNINFKNIGWFRVSFFWPFYGDFKILYIDKGYKFAIISGSSSKYFWILSRTNEIENETMAYLLNKAEELGFDKSKMIFN